MRRATLKTRGNRLFARIRGGRSCIVGSFGRGGRNAGQFYLVPALAVDSQGAIYTAEVSEGKRVQKFVKR
jgi:hypothetical protein